MAGPLGSVEAVLAFDDNLPRGSCKALVSEYCVEMLDKFATSANICSPACKFTL